MNHEVFDLAKAVQQENRDRAAASLPESQPQKDFDALTILVARTIGGEEWKDADDSQILEEFDPWEALRKVSQPSPSGDAADEIVQTLMPSMDREMFLRHTQKVAEIIRSHDAKVSGQAEQRLRTTLQQCAIKFREYATIHGQKEATHENREKVKANLVMAELAEAALQESPSEPAR